MRRASRRAAWQQSAQAPPIAPTLELFDVATCKNAGANACTKVAVFFVTGRHHSSEAKGWTEKNLTNARYQGWTDLYMRDAATRGSPVSDHKTSARVDIERKGFTIIANIGDQLSDLTGGHAERTFKVPNPFYFIP